MTTAEQTTSEAKASQCVLCGGRHVDAAKECPEIGYDRPTYLDAPCCPRCGHLYCYCVERYAKVR